MAEKTEDKGVFLGSFEGLKDVIEAFELESLEGIRILLAVYDLGEYEGTAFVLFEQGGKLMEVNASHCSCYGLEGQWEPEETTSAVLREQIKRGCFELFADDIEAELDNLGL